MLNRVSLTLLSAGTYMSRIITGASDSVKPYISPNYEHNRSVRLNGFVYDQTQPPASTLRMGYRNGSYNGCGWVAIYNAARIIGRNYLPADIIKHLEESGGIVLNGILGSNPLSVRDFFLNNGMKADIQSFPKETDKLIVGSKAAVLAYCHKRGMHFVAVEYSDGRYYVYNERPGCLRPQCYHSIDSWLKSQTNRFTAVSLIRVF